MKDDTKNDRNLSQCRECGLHYKDKELYEKCETWCEKYKTCNVEITKHAEENSGVESWRVELDECKKKCEEYLNNWKRERADFLNYRRDEVEKMEMLAKYAKEDTIFKILPTLDSIELAQRQMPEDIKTNAWSEGFSQIQKQIMDFLKKEGIEEIKAVGEPFDPETMESIEQVEGGESGKVAEEAQKGYTMNGKVLRPAKVKVNK